MNKSKNKKYIYLLVVLSLISIIFLIFKTNNSQITKEPTQSTAPVTKEIASFGDITPGKTSLEKINELLGTPISTEEQDGKTASLYKTSNEFRNHRVISENGVSQLVIEEVINSEKNASDIQIVYGTNPSILYEKSPSSVFNLYVYPENGIAYLGHEDGTVIEIWYFEPTNMDNFKREWGKDFLISPNTDDSQY